MYPGSFGVPDWERFVLPRVQHYRGKDLNGRIVKDLSGRHLMNVVLNGIEGNNELLVDMSALQSGLYLITLQNAQSVYSKAWVKTE